MKLQQKNLVVVDLNFSLMLMKSNSFIFILMQKRLLVLQVISTHA